MCEVLSAKWEVRGCDSELRVKRYVLRKKDM